MIPTDRAERVARIVKEAPALSADQLSRIGALLRGSAPKKDAAEDLTRKTVS